MDGRSGQTTETLEIIYLTIDYRPEELGISLYIGLSLILAHKYIPKLLRTKYAKNQVKY